MPAAANLAIALFAVTGFAPEGQITRNRGALPGDALVLTKPLGIGITVSAGRADSLAAEGVGRHVVLCALLRPFDDAVDRLREHIARTPRRRARPHQASAGASGWILFECSLV